MKSLKQFLPVLAILAFAAPAFAGQTCADYVQQAVASQAKSDFPNVKNLEVVLPAISEDGGSVMNYDIPVVSAAKPGVVIATYEAMVDETCSVSLTLK